VGRRRARPRDLKEHSLPGGGKTLDSYQGPFRLTLPTGATPPRPTGISPHTVILSAVASSRSEEATQSKDPYRVRESKQSRREFRATEKRTRARLDLSRAAECSSQETRNGLFGQGYNLIHDAGSPRIAQEGPCPTRQGASGSRWHFDREPRSNGRRKRGSRVAGRNRTPPRRGSIRKSEDDLMRRRPPERACAGPQ
jgi:hypothetical protein